MLQSIKTVYQTKALQRTGWVANKIPFPETVAAHQFGAAFLALMFAKECGLDETHCIKMALCHDIQEATVGDITPY